MWDSYGKLRIAMPGTQMTMTMTMAMTMAITMTMTMTMAMTIAMAMTIVGKARVIYTNPNQAARSY